MRMTSPSLLFFFCQLFYEEKFFDVLNKQCLHSACPQQNLFEEKTAKNSTQIVSPKSQCITQGAVAGYMPQVIVK